MIQIITSSKIKSIQALIDSKKKSTILLGVGYSSSNSELKEVIDEVPSEVLKWMEDGLNSFRYLFLYDPKTRLYKKMKRSSIKESDTSDDSNFKYFIYPGYSMHVDEKGRLSSDRTQLDGGNGNDPLGVLMESGDTILNLSKDNQVIGKSKVFTNK